MLEFSNLAPIRVIPSFAFNLFTFLQVEDLFLGLVSKVRLFVSTIRELVPSKMRSLLSSTIEFNSPSSLYLFLKRQIVPLGFALPSAISVAFINLKISHSTAIVKPFVFG